jgi:hypothetical protein
MEDDPFEEILDLEETYYQEGYALGVEDGSRTGRIEGRIFGLEKGFEKFAAMGLLHGKASVWGSRIPGRIARVERAQADSNELAKPSTDMKDALTGVSSSEQAGMGKAELPQLLPNPRLAKHITTLHALTELPTFSTSNTEDAIADFDDRFKRAGAKAKVIERILGEGDVNAAVETEAEASQATPSSSAKPREKERSVKLSQSDRSADNMEDFGGLQGI